VERRADQLARFAHALPGGAKGAANIAALPLRNAALKAGLGWAESAGNSSLALEYRSDARTARIETTSKHAGERLVAGRLGQPHRQQGHGHHRGARLLAITLKDRAGTQYESMDIEAKGLASPNSRRSRS